MAAEPAPDLISRQIKAALEIPAAEGPKICYPVAVLKNSRDADQAKRFVQFLKSASSMAVFKRFGFSSFEKGQ